MKPLFAVLAMTGLLAGCDITADAPPPGDSTPAATPVPRSGPGSTAGPGAPSTAKPTPARGDWLWKDYKNPLNTPKPKTR